MTHRRITPEGAVLKACLDILAAHRIWHERRNVGTMRDGKRFVRFGRPGTADILATPPMYAQLLIGGPMMRTTERTVLWIECKSVSGRLSPAQILFRGEVLDAGHAYLIVRRAEDLLDWLKEHSVMQEGR